MTDAERRVEQLEDTLERIAQWCTAYPITVFLPLSNDEIRRAGEVLNAAGISMDALHGGWARHLLEGIGKEARTALSALE